MKLVALTIARELKLPGTHVEFVTEGTTLKELILRPEGEEVSYSIKYGESYASSIKVFRRQDHELKDAWRLTGVLCGFPISKDFDTEAEARRELDKVQVDMVNPQVTKVQVKVDEDGEPVRTTLNDDIPF